MLLVRTYLAKSELHGIGLFAAEPIAAGTVVQKFDPRFDRVFDVSRVDMLGGGLVMQEFISHYCYLKSRRLWLCFDDARFINHSDDPNLDSKSDYLSDIAKRDIAAGEEITADYSHFDESWQEKLGYG